MSSRFLQFEPEMIATLDRCLEAAILAAQEWEPGTDISGVRHRLASALVEAVRSGLREERELLEFALRALPAYRAKSIASFH